MDKYFEIKYYLEYVVPAIIVVIFIVKLSIGIFKESRIDKFMIKQGYELKLTNVAALGDGRTYSWCDNDHIVIDQQELYSKGLKYAKANYKRK